VSVAAWTDASVLIGCCPSGTCLGGKIFACNVVIEEVGVLDMRKLQLAERGELTGQVSLVYRLWNDLAVRLCFEFSYTISALCPDFP
jgi:hypothetical protein